MTVDSLTSLRHIERMASSQVPRREWSPKLNSASSSGFLSDFVGIEQLS